MIRIVLVGIWVLVVALGSSYVSASWQSADATKPKPATYFDGLDYRTTGSITVPMIDKNTIKGYILARFVYTIDGKTFSELKVPPDPFILDLAFQQLYSIGNFDFDNPSRFDLAALTSSIRDEVNQKFGSTLVHDVLVDQFDYIPQKEVRDGPDKIARG